MVACICITSPAVVLLFGCLLHGALAKHVQGRVSLAAKQAFVVQKFCFDFLKCNNTDDCLHPGTMHFTVFNAIAFSPSPASVAHKLHVTLLDDEYFSFPTVSQVWGEARCEDVLGAAKSVHDLKWSHCSTPQGQNMSVNVREQRRPRWWYIAFVSCTNTPIELSYKMHFENLLQGAERELPMDMVNVFYISIAFSIVLIALGVAHLQSLHEWRGVTRTSHWSRLHPALHLVSIAVFSAIAGEILWIAYFWEYRTNGRPNEYGDFLARLAMNLSKTTSSILLMLFAQGNCVCTADINWKDQRELVGGMCFFGFLSLILELWGDSDFRSTTTEFIYDTRAGTLLVAFDLLWLWMFTSRSFQTYQQENRLQPRYFFKVYAPLFSLWFGSLPLIAAVARILAPWVRYRITFLISGSAHAFLLVVLVMTLRPKTAVNLYMLEAHKYKTVDDEELSSIIGRGDDSDEEI